jgi:hypothetical protein
MVARYSLRKVLWKRASGAGWMLLVAAACVVRAAVHHGMPFKGLASLCIT